MAPTVERALLQKSDPLLPDERYGTSADLRRFATDLLEQRRDKRVARQQDGSDWTHSGSWIKRLGPSRTRRPGPVTANDAIDTLVELLSYMSDQWAETCFRAIGRCRASTGFDKACQIASAYARAMDGSADEKFRLTSVDIL